MKKEMIKIKLDLDKLKKEQKKHKETVDLVDEFLASNKKGEKNGKE